ncbi:MAG: DHA2 family efflux MFS transporter permease subunit [Patescibacteria group bacterium]
MANFVTAETQEKSAKPNISPMRKWSILLVLSLALAIIILDTTILNVALTTIIQDLHTTIQKIQWVITAYALTLAALTITGGRLGDLFGRKRMFIFGALLFAVGSFIASVATNVGWLIAGEAIIEGIGAALMLPATTSLLIENFEGRDRAIAFGVWGGIAGAAAALGPILGGFLSTRYSWRWGFRINPIVALILVACSVIIPASKKLERKTELDWMGVFLSAFGLLGIVFGMIEASEYGWWKAKEIFQLGGRALTMPWGLSIVPFSIAIGILIVAGFFAWEYAHEKDGHTPLVSLKLFKNRTFTIGVIMNAVLALGQTGLIFSLPVFLQAVRHLDAYHTGLSLLPMSLALLIVAPLSAILGRKIPPKILIVLGLAINVVSYLVLRQALTVTTDVWHLAPGLALFGIGFGFVISQINNLTLSSVPMQAAGEASGVNNTMRQVGASFGSAIIGTILISVMSAQLVSGVAASTVLPTQVKTTLSQTIGAQASNIEFSGAGTIGGSLPADAQSEISRIAAEATVTANKTTLLYGAIFAFAGLLIGLLLPMGTKKETAPAQEPASATAARPTWEPSGMQTVSANALTAGSIADLITLEKQRLEKGLSGVHADVRALIANMRAAEEGILTTGAIAELIELERQRMEKGKAGMHLEVRSLIDRLQAELRES